MRSSFSSSLPRSISARTSVCPVCCSMIRPLSSHPDGCRSHLVIVNGLIAIESRMTHSAHTKRCQDTQSYYVRAIGPVHFSYLHLFSRHHTLGGSWQEDRRQQREAEDREREIAVDREERHVDVR